MKKRVSIPRWAIAVGLLGAVIIGDMIDLADKIRPYIPFMNRGV